VGIRALIYLYGVLSIGILAAGVRSRRAALLAWPLAIAANIFPLVTYGYLGEDQMRLWRVPIGDLPFIAAAFALWAYTRKRWSPVERRLGLVVAALWAYQATSVLWVESYASFVQYYGLWIVNFSVLLAACRLARTAPTDNLRAVLRLTSLVIALGCAVGLAKIPLGMNMDANYMPLSNRNGTVMMTVLILPVVLYLASAGRIRLWAAVLVLALVLLSVAYTSSRMGLVGTAFAIVTFALTARWSPRLLAAAAVLLLVSGVMYTSPQGMELRTRMDQVPAMGRAVLYGNDVPNGDGLRRVALMQEAWRIWHEHLWLGTGVGLANYLRYFSGSVKPAKPHCFYLSYLAELGVAGFTLMMLLIICCGLVLLRNWRSARRGGDRDRLLCASAGLSVYAAALAMLALNEYATMPFVWFLLGLLMGGGARRHRARPVRTEIVRPSSAALRPRVAVGARLPVLRAAGTRTVFSWSGLSHAGRVGAAPGGGTRAASPAAAAMAAGGLATQHVVGALKPIAAARSVWKGL
jgi:O-antigen ligase